MRFPVPFLLATLPLTFAIGESEVDFHARDVQGSSSDLFGRDSVSDFIATSSEAGLFAREALFTQDIGGFDNLLQARNPTSCCLLTTEYGCAIHGTYDPDSPSGCARRTNHADDDRPRKPNDPDRHSNDIGHIGRDVPEYDDDLEARDSGSCCLVVGQNGCRVYGRADPNSPTGCAQQTSSISGGQPRKPEQRRSVDIDLGVDDSSLFSRSADIPWDILDARGEPGCCIKSRGRECLETAPASQCSSYNPKPGSGPQRRDADPPVLVINHPPGNPGVTGGPVPVGAVPTRRSLGFDIGAEENILLGRGAGDSPVYLKTRNAADIEPFPSLLESRVYHPDVPCCAQWAMNQCRKWKDTPECLPKMAGTPSMQGRAVDVELDMGAGVC